MTTNNTGRTETKPPGNSAGHAIAPAPRPALSIDVDHYQSLFDDDDMPEAQKRELIETLWSIIVSFVDLGWNIHPLQQAKDDSEIDRGLQILIAEMHQGEPVNTKWEETPERSEA